MFSPHVGCIGSEAEVTGSSDVGSPLDAVVRFLVSETAFVGIGPASAHRLRDGLGDDLPRALADGDVATLATILGEGRAADLVSAWRERQGLADIVLWLAEAGFDRRLAGRVLALWGVGAARRLHGRPYDLMALAPWATVDRAARRMGVGPRAPERLVASVEGVLYERFEEHHTWIPRAALLAEVARRLGPGTNDAARALDLALSERAAFEVDGGFQPGGAYMMERYVADRLRKMLSSGAGGDLVSRPVTDAGIDAWLDGPEASDVPALDPEQRRAVLLALRAPVGLLVGGAGVGKTTVLRAVCGAAARHGQAVHLIALAGRAAVRMAEATGHPASTVAAFLGRVESGEVTLGGQSLVVVDEASMIDLPTFYRLLRRMPGGCRLLLVGDDAQLPPIGFGLAFHELVSFPDIPKVTLVRVHRQAEATGIPQVAAAVRAGTLPAMGRTLEGPGFGVTFLDGSAGGAATLDDVVDAVATCGGWRDDLRVLCPTKGGTVGADAVNARLHALLTHGRDRMPGRGFAVGEPVMFLRNDYRLGLRNGSLGTVTGIADGILEADFDGVTHALSGPSLDDTALAYAVTVHKAQGSAFRRVVVPVAQTRLLDRSLVYTAITRAREQAVLVGDRKAFARAVTSTAHAHARMTGLRAALLA